MIKARSSFLLMAFSLLATFTAMATARDTATTGVTTLYARDPLGQSLCFRDGGFGSVFQENEVRNRCSDINFNSYNADAFTVGIEGGREGVILNIGKPSDLQKRYGYDETVGSGQGFASIRLEGGNVWILKDRRSRSMQELKGAEALFAQPAQTNQSAPVRVGEIYLLRITDRSEKNYQMAAKLIVISHVPGESVTFRWQVLWPVGIPNGR